ncbi:hypothetical protein SAMN02799630_00562 [Paenibacillus sp. UNCCL117]|uniref:hypothetical protein n=1 Tax=unclassified Paenibacillus TaxID=185978 RepID=UPI000883A771|nr:MULTISPECIES: hypothetical protein [unclassified Paenibacillus]SDC11194.1 hypothetical protein SAMN04488602_101362 [Paenibacillus sp. cl123]SFW16541.1 hypothetical protein SAMN02799630_00562 [Paenibacillus sp. UNCCL117]
MEQNSTRKYEALLLDEDRLYTQIETCEEMINAVLDNIYHSAATLDYETVQNAVSAITNIELVLRVELAAVRTDKVFLARLMKLREDGDDLKDEIMRCAARHYAT